MNFEIDRKGVINVLIKVRDEYKARYLYNEHLEPYYKYLCEVRLAALDYAIKELKKQIIVQPEQKPGRWIHDEEHQGDIHCSLCDEIIVVDDESWANAYFRFCPYCGARMEK